MQKFPLLFLLALFLLPFSAFAAADLSISSTDITFSKTEILAGDVVRIYARVFNKGDIDQGGQIAFTANNEKIGAAQQISIRPGTYDDVFIDWKPSKGTFTVSATITGADPADNNAANNTVTIKEVAVAPDTNQNGVADAKETSTTPTTMPSQTGSAENPAATSQATTSLETVKNTVQETAGQVVKAAEPLYQKTTQAIQSVGGEHANVANFLMQPASIIETLKDWYAKNPWWSWILLGVILLIMIMVVVKRFFKEV